MMFLEIALIVGVMTLWAVLTILIVFWLDK